MNGNSNICPIENKSPADVSCRKSTAGRRGLWKKIFSILGNVVFASFLLVMITLVFFLLQSRINSKTPSVLGRQLYVVLSGSMTPAFETGSVIAVQPVDPETLAIGDVITFKNNESSEYPTTHRIVNVNREGGLSFTTRGDANNVDDPLPVSAGNVTGKVLFSIPYFGYLVEFVRTKKGMISLVFLPVALILFHEVRNLFIYAAEINEKNRGLHSKETISK